jgi:hypothetical protein
MQLEGATDLEMQLYATGVRVELELPSSALATDISSALSLAGARLQEQRAYIGVQVAQLRDATKAAYGGQALVDALRDDAEVQAARIVALEEECGRLQALSVAGALGTWHLETR